MSIVRTMLPQPNKAWYFKGDGYISVPLSPTFTSDRTWELWINPPLNLVTVPYVNQTIYEEGVTYAGQMFYVYANVNPGRLAVDCWGRGWYFSSYKINIYQWNHVVFTYNHTSKKGKYYINGVFDVETPAYRETGFFNTDRAYVGGNPMRASGRYYNGYIAVARVYNKELSVSEIRHNMLNPNNPIRDGLVLWLDARACDVSKNICYDLSGNGNHGTMYNVSIVTLPNQIAPGMVM